MTAGVQRPSCQAILSTSFLDALTSQLTGYGNSIERSGRPGRTSTSPCQLATLSASFCSSTAKKPRHCTTDSARHESSRHPHQQLFASDSWTKFETRHRGTEPSPPLGRRKIGKTALARSVSANKGGVDTAAKRGGRVARGPGQRLVALDCLHLLRLALCTVILHSGDIAPVCLFPAASRRHQLQGATKSRLASRCRLPIVDRGHLGFARHHLPHPTTTPYHLETDHGDHARRRRLEAVRSGKLYLSLILSSSMSSSMPSPVVSLGPLLLLLRARL